MADLPSNKDPILSAISTRLQNIDEILERNTQQLGALTEGLTRLENTVTTGFNELKQNLSQQYEITRMQGQHIDRLIALLEQRDNADS